MTARTGDLSILRRDGVSVRRVKAQAHVLIVCVDDSESRVEEIRDVAGIDMPTVPGAVTETVYGIAFWLSPRTWLLRLPERDQRALLDAVRIAFPDRRVHATPYSDALSWYVIDGPDAASLLARGGFVSLARGGFPVGRGKRTLIADLPVLIWRCETNLWQVGVERSRAPYFSEWMESSIVIGDERTKQ